MAKKIAQVKNIVKRFPGVTALDGISLELEEKKIYGLIGPNGSGKSTLFNVITGFHKPDSGKIFFKGENITDLGPDETFAKGIARNFQIERIPENITLLENLLLAGLNKKEKSVIQTLYNAIINRGEKEKLVSRAIQILDEQEMGDYYNNFSKTLSGGQRKLLSICRILITESDLILLDEATAGVNPTLTNKILKLFRELKDEKSLTMVLIEHDMNVIYELVDEIIVLNRGRKLAEGTPDAIRDNDEVLKAYLTH